MKYDVIIIGAGPGGIFAAYELMQLKPELKVAVFEAGHALRGRHCPIDGDKIKSCIGCKSCSIMSGFGGAGAFSDGKYNTPTLQATPGDLSLVLPKRILDGIIEMIYALDKVAPGTANEDTLLYGVEVKFYNMEVEVSDKLESRYKGLYIIGDGSGITHSLSHASASGVHVARNMVE